MTASDRSSEAEMASSTKMQTPVDVYREAGRIVFLCVMWYTSSLCQNVINKHLFSEFPYPTTVAMAHMLAVAVFLAPVLKIWKVPPPEIIENRKFMYLILPLAFGKFFASVSAEFSILKVSVSFAHTVKATMPIFTVLLSRFILGEKQTTFVYLSLCPIICGVVIATLTELSFDTLGLLAALTATITFALQNVYSKKALCDIGIHHLRLLLILGQLAAAMLFPVWMVLDLRRIVVDYDMHETINWVWVFSLLFMTGFLNFLQNIFAFSVLSLITPLSYSIANATKRIVIILLSLAMLRNPVTMVNIMGMMTAIFGVFCYNLAKYHSNVQRKKPFLPMVASDLLDGRLLSQSSPSMDKRNGHMYQV